MIPRTFPSILGALGETKMVVYVLPSVSGLQAWKDYIPVKGITTENTAVQNTYANDGYQVMSPLEDISTKQAWKDYIPVFEDASYTKAWSTDAGGYIPASGLFSVYSLFANNEQGVWYDPSDITTLFQDAAGTTPVTAVEQPVGLMLDKSKGLALGPELVTNGTFDSNVNGWSVAGSTSQVALTWVTGGFANIKMITNTGDGAIQDIPLASGYAKVSIRARKVGASGNAYIVLYAKSGFSTQLASAKITSQSLNTYEFIVPATNGGFRVYLKVEWSNAEMEVDNVSIRELLGNHAYQTTSANRPTLSARYNLLTKTEQFDDAAWTKYNTSISANSNVAPDGALAADVLIEDTANAVHGFYKILPATATQYTFSVFLKKKDRRYAVLSGAVSASDYRFATFDLETGTVTNTGSGTTSSIISVGNGWYRCCITYTATATASWYTQVQLSNSSAAGYNYSYTGDGYSGIYIWGADLRVANDGVGIPAYQRVNTATDYDTVGFPKYLSFNGSSSAMLTNTITPGTDKAQVFAGVRKLGATGGMVTELDTQYATGNGKIALFSPTGDGANYHGFFSKGSNSSPATVNGYAPPVTNVITGLGDISGDSAILRVNNTQVASNTADQGTGNYLAYPLYIGARAGTSLWFNGRVYSMIVRFGSNLTTAQITNTEKYVNSKTKAY